MIKSAMIDKKTWGILFGTRYTKRYNKLLAQEYGKTLEIGQGQGVFTIDLLKQGVDVVCLDNSKECIKVANDMFRLNDIGTTIYEGDITKQLPFEDNSFDTSVCSEVLEHLYYPRKAIGELVRVTKRDIYITVPAKGVMPPKQTKGHVQDFEMADIISFMRYYGVHVTHWETDGIFSYVFGRVRKNV
jgi:ubiquinone/menaquinone biosynthesis C-methylase UbiE